MKLVRDGWAGLTMRAAGGRPLHLRIRTKFIGILIIAAVLPLCIALLAANALGYRYYRQAQGRLLETMAQNLAHNASLTVNSHIESVLRWLEEGALEGYAARAPAPLSRERFLSATEKWPRLRETDPEYRRLIDPALSRELTSLMFLGRFADIIVLNARGEVTAATSKPVRFSRAGEPWWGEAMRLAPGEVLVRGLEPDDVKGEPSIGLVFPIFAPGSSGAPPVAIVKAAMRPPRTLASPRPQQVSRERQISVALWGNGSDSLWRLGGDRIGPVGSPLSPEASRALSQERSGWTLTPLTDDTAELVGHASLMLIRSSESGLHKLLPSDLRVLMHGKAAEVLAPVRKQIYMVGGGGLLLVAGCAFAGYFIATREIIEPIEKLRAAAQGVAESVELESPGADPPPPSARATKILQEIEGISTGDELEELSREFSFMASRVLTYHQQLESEIALKTSEMQGDLKMAKDFQEALMPKQYPPVPANPKPGGLRLDFSHIYTPTSTVGGDFFDVIQLSDSQAGIFIADVMGHGARSALITAILRTLLQDFAQEAREPAQLLEVVNTHFHDIVRQSNEFLFVSAFYLVIDVEHQKASYASAGHPAPLLAEGCRVKVAPLIEDLRDNPALGLFPEQKYQQWSKSITHGDVFLLFTDGIYEAANAQGEEFGQIRMGRILAENRTRPLPEITAALVDSLSAFRKNTPLTDDLCMVAVGVSAAGRAG